MLVVIDPDGMLRSLPAPAGPGLLDRFGRDAHRVGLNPVWPVTGWELADTEWLPRNPVGACVLAELGGPRLVFAGPVAVTGWNPDTTVPLSTRARTQDLTPDRVGYVKELHTDVTAAINGAPTGRSAVWVDGVCCYAGMVRTARWLPRSDSVAAARLWATEQVRRAH